MPAPHILWIDDPRLKTISQPVDVVNDDTRAIVEKMFTVLDATKESALAAIQLGIPQQIIVTDITDGNGHRQRLTLINPQITARSAEQSTHLELCSSIPGHPMPASRARQIHVTFLDEQGHRQQIEAEGTFAICLQHEFDHLSGKFFTAGVSSLKRQRICKQLAKLQRKR